MGYIVKECYTVDWLYFQFFRTVADLVNMFSHLRINSIRRKPAFTTKLSRNRRLLIGGMLKRGWACWSQSRYLEACCRVCFTWRTVCSVKCVMFRYICVITYYERLGKQAECRSPIGIWQYVHVHRHCSFWWQYWRIPEVRTYVSLITHKLRHMGRTG